MLLKYLTAYHGTHFQEENLLPSPADYYLITDSSVNFTKFKMKVNNSIKIDNYALHT